ncbi:hypothetical protein JQC67_17075 [Aurantibacter crassamenti]|uniref:hypothetical protein n=1 Tax=Aurantibacter crassamenti TaxID=1837375 RepID=UPI00193A8A7E|nr:hypothetical protein [Aurantibacter crassamenti]MBM1107870.1 hypothetical protein [Aurantibacter crassamenti]
MKTFLLKYTALLILTMPLVMSANSTELKGKHTKEKTIKKEFNVNSDALLKVKNSYGNLNITSWNENRILIEVHIITNGNNEDKVQRKLDEINVDFENSSSVVSARTFFGSKSSSWGWNWSNNNVNMQVNYTIKLPVKNSVHLNNDYGSIILDRIDGHAKISCDYGRLEIGELRGRNNELKFDYTSNSSIEYMNSGTIEADYSGFTLGKTKDITLDADYTNSTIKQMENLKYDCDYGKLEVDMANNISGDGDYLNVRLGTIHGNVEINADYGQLKIEEMAADAGNLNVVSDYTGVKMGYNAAYHFNFEIDIEYGGFNGKEELEINVSNIKSTSKYYKGYHGNQNSGNSVSISSDYGSVTFHKN